MEDLYSRFRFPPLPEEVYLKVVVDVIELIGPRTLLLGPKEMRECERSFHLPERGGNQSFLWIKISPPLFP